mmetsp:Transcript_14474/g.31043  ORF Transcript_14474/g.31043 Transcript_14474/m.31043 type:complete len:361 (+) Transcript_14474:129-1211(+)|eukprot:6199258-Pleurochrysis_carterae.AAC.1
MRIGAVNSKALVRCSHLPAAMVVATRGVSLLLATQTDPASVVQHASLLEIGSWQKLDTPTSAWCRGNARLWLLDEDFKFCNEVDERWTNESGETVSEVIFLSRHSAASGKPCLTVHPIGMPWRASDEDVQVYGGRSCAAVPPNPRLAPLYRRLCTIKRGDAPSGSPPLPSGFDVSLEATHHGPWLRTPSLFIEIGSTEEEWGRKDAADVLAHVLWEELGLARADENVTGDLSGQYLSETDAHANADESAPNQVAVGVGGGHYCPRLGDLCRKPGFSLGHVLANYGVRFADCTDSTDPEAAQKSLDDGGGAHAILEAVKQTQAAFPHATPVAYVDKKSFKGWQRKAVLDLLTRHGIDQQLI